MKTRIISPMVAGTALCLLALLTSCNSPEKKGRRIAERENKIYEKGREQFEKLDESFTVSFSPEKYTCRKDAKDDWLSRHEKITDEINSALSNAKTDMRVMLADMKRKDINDFQKGYNKESMPKLQTEVWQRMYDTECPDDVMQAISRIKPPKPDVEKIKEDLQDRTIKDVEGGYYYGAHKLIKVDEYDITELKILDVELESESEYIVNISLTLSGKVNRDRVFNIVCKLRYLLPQYDDWTIDFIKTNELTPVSSSIYKDCVKLDHYGGWIGKDLYVKNECDKSLEVFVRYYEYGKWFKTVVVAKALENTQVDYGESDEKVIDYILPL